MRLLRNKECRIVFLILLLITACTCLLSIFLAGVQGLFCCLISCVFLIVVFILFEYKKYRRIDLLSNKVDQLLNGNFEPGLDKNQAGDFGVLESEIFKITSMLKKQSDALQADKQFLSDSLADISHQLKTPLTSMNMITVQLRSPNLPAEEHAKLLQELYALLNRMEWQISTLLKLSKIDAKTAVFQKETISLSDLVQTSCRALEIPMELRGIRLICKGQENSSFTGDLMWTSEAVSNIVKNCMEHTPENGTITVTYGENAVYSYITVTDTGNGIAPEDLPHLFERFYRSKNASHSGVGIGLALSNMIIKSQNGIIKAENHPQTGGAHLSIRFYKVTI